MILGGCLSGGSGGGPSGVSALPGGVFLCFGVLQDARHTHHTALPSPFVPQGSVAGFNRFAHSAGPGRLDGGFEASRFRGHRGTKTLEFDEEQLNSRLRPPNPRIRRTNLRIRIKGLRTRRKNLRIRPGLLGGFGCRSVMSDGCRI